MVWPDATFVGLIAGPVLGLAIAVWWVFFSRASAVDRWGGLGLMIVSLAVTSRLVDRSIAGGMMGMMFAFYAVPVMSLVFAGWAVASRNLREGARRVTMAASILLACGGMLLVRTEGISGAGNSAWEWRWTKTAEEKLLAQPAAPLVVEAAAAAPVVDPPPQAVAPVRPMAAAVRWTGFRGPDRNGVVPGVRIETGWAASPPVEMWRRPVGPGWSSFAVEGGLFYTQEQRGEEEVVACYRVESGDPVWLHRDAARFWESNGGAGPRGTPTLHGGRVYAFGATGILNALDARTGAVIWSRNAGSDAKKKIPGWGFSSSPLILGDLVIVAAAGQLAAFDRQTGANRWLGPAGEGGYSSPHLMTIGGVQQIVLISGAGVVGVAPEDGTLLWRHDWPGDGIVQPAQTEDGDVLIGSGSGMGGGAGVRRISVKQSADGWTANEVWTSPGLKPYFNDFAVHRGHAYGFDGRILSCIDLKDGKRKWKGGRFGYGQLVLLPDQELLLVLSEEGELGLAAAGTDEYRELGRVKAIEGKTWNHPVLAGTVLLVRNSEEMAAYRLSATARTAVP